MYFQVFGYPVVASSPIGDDWLCLVTLGYAWLLSGVYILSQTFIIAPKRDKRMMKIFIIAPNLHISQNEIS